MNIEMKLAEQKQLCSLAARNSIKSPFGWVDGQLDSEPEKHKLRLRIMHLSSGNKYLQGSFHGLARQLARKKNLCKWTENTTMTFTIKTQMSCGVESGLEKGLFVFFARAQMSQLCIWFIDRVVRCCSSVHIEPYSINLTAATPASRRTSGFPMRPYMLKHSWESLSIRALKDC